MAIDWEAISKEKELKKKAEFIRQGGTAIDWEAISKEKELKKKAEFIRQRGVSDLEKSEDSSFKSPLSSYQLGGGGPLSKLAITLIFGSSVIYVMIKQMGFPDFVEGMCAHFVVLAIISILYSVFKNDKPDEEA
jgi:hypothetical protein